MAIPRHLALGLLVLCAVVLITGSAARQLGYFWQITDAHLDMSYLPGADPDCDTVQCCRNKTDTQKNFAGPMGDYNCDSPVKLFQAVLDFVRSYPLPNGQKPAFIHYGGDDTPHDNWMQSREYNLNYISTVHNMLVKSFDQYCPVFQTLGNHDTYPVDQVKVGYWSWLFEPVADMWAKWLPPQAVNTTRQSGFYSVPNFLPGLTLINLYSQYQDPLNFYLILTPNDPGGQIAWFANELAIARANKQKVYIFAHIPVGIEASASQSSIEKFNVAFEKLIQEYSDIVVATFHGHTHKDSVRVVLSPDAKEAVHVAYVASAVTPWTGHNPTVRLYTFDTDTYELVDYLTFYTNLTRANEIGKYEFQLEYSPLKAYGMKDLSPQSWLDFIDSMFTDDAKYKLFRTYYQSLGPSKDSKCEGACRIKHLCSLRAVVQDKFLDCLAAHGAEL